jgi:hypothetical protein
MRISIRCTTMQSTVGQPCLGPKVGVDNFAGKAANAEKQLQGRLWVRLPR